MNLKYTLGLIIGLTMGTMPIGTLMVQQGEAVTIPILAKNEAPSAVVGDNIYIAWWTNKTGNDEIMFRVSNDAGATFGDKINLSNTTASDSQDAGISADGSNVVVTWWERNQTSNEPAAKISTDNGQTFGPVLKLATNGTVGTEGEE
jgi:hypothetical protein